MFFLDELKVFEGPALTVKNNMTYSFFERRNNKFAPETLKNIHVVRY